MLRITISITIFTFTKTRQSMENEDCDRLTMIDMVSSLIWYYMKSDDILWRKENVKFCWFRDWDWVIPYKNLVNYSYIWLWLKVEGVQHSGPTKMVLYFTGATNILYTFGGHAVTVWVFLSLNKFTLFTNPICQSYSLGHY